MDSNNIQDSCFYLFDWSWLDCYECPPRANSMPSWKPYTQSNNESKIEEICKKCNYCSQIKKVFQVCSSRDNNFYFCSSNCWEQWIENSSSINNNEYDSEEFFI